MGLGVTSGIGFDYILPYFNNRIAIRPIQADFAYSHVDYGPPVLPAFVTGGLGEIYAYRLSAGIVLRLGGTSVPPPPSLGALHNPSMSSPAIPSNSRPFPPI